MTLRTRVDFTHRELTVLADVLEQAKGKVVIEGRVEQAAALRAVDKIQRAHRKAVTGNAADPDVFCNACDNRGKNTIGLNGQNFGCSGCGYILGEHPNRIRA